MIFRNMPIAIYLGKRVPNSPPRKSTLNLTFITLNSKNTLQSLSAYHYHTTNMQYSLAIVAVVLAASPPLQTTGRLQKLDRGLLIQALDFAMPQVQAVAR